MSQITKEGILSALREVSDPDLRKDIVSLGFVQKLSITGNDVSFTLNLTTPACPVRDLFKSQCEKAIRTHFPSVGTIGIDMTSSVSSHLNQQKEQFLPGVKNTIAVASGKGGVGKSTVATNLAVSLALEGATVGLLDADIYGPSIPLMFGITEKPKISDNKLIPVTKHNVKVMSIGFLVDPMEAVIWRGPMASGALRQFMTDVEWGELDYLVFDLPPGTGDIQLTLVQTLPLTGAVIVTTPQSIALADAKKGLVMFNKVNVPVLGLIENMSYYRCSACGNKEYIFDNGGGSRTAQELNIPFLGDIPLETKIRTGGDEGVPVVLGYPELEQAQIIRTIAKNLAAQVSIRNLGEMQKPNVEILLN